MLVLTRKQKEEIRIGDNVKITILRVKGQSVRIGIEAPNDVRVIRGELKPHGDETASASQSSSTNEPKSALPLSNRLSQRKTVPNSSPSCRGLLEQASNESCRNSVTMPECRQIPEKKGQNRTFGSSSSEFLNN